LRKIGAGHYRCTICGAEIRTDDEQEAPFDFIVARPEHPNERVVTLRGKEIHRCVVRPESGPQRSRPR